MLIFSCRILGENSITGGWKRSGMEPIDRNAEGWTQAINSVGFRSAELSISPEVQSEHDKKVMEIRQVLLDHYKEWVTKPVENLKQQLQEKSNPSPPSKKSYIPVTALGLDCSTDDLLGQKTIFVFQWLQTILLI